MWWDVMWDSNSLLVSLIQVIQIVHFIELVEKINVIKSCQSELY